MDIAAGYGNTTRTHTHSGHMDRTGGISVPCRYIHSPVEMTDLVDFKACVDLTVAYATAELN